LEESQAVFEAFCRGPQVLIGSSMGGWMALLLARKLRQQSSAPAPASVAGLVLIAPAVDFTEVLMWRKFPPAARRAILEQGFFARPSEYSEEPYRISRELIEEGRSHLLLGGGMIETGCP